MELSSSIELGSADWIREASVKRELWSSYEIRSEKQEIENGIKFTTNWARQATTNPTAATTTVTIHHHLFYFH